MGTHQGAYDQPFFRMFSTVNWMLFCDAMPSCLHGIAVFATHRASVPLGPPGPSRAGLPAYPVKAAAERGADQSATRCDMSSWARQMVGHLPRDSLIYYRIVDGASAAVTAFRARA